MATAAGSELRVDVHSIEPIPEADKDSTGAQQLWIWAGANIAPIDRSVYGDINCGAIVAFIVGLVAGWSVEQGLVPALQGPISTKLLSGADLSWLVVIVVAGGAYLLLGRREVTVPVPRPRGAGG